MPPMTETPTAETMHIEAVLTKQTLKKDEKTKDLVFDLIAVDKNKEPNALGFVFDWRRPEDIDLSMLSSNPVLLWNHDNYALPIGRVERMNVSGRAVRMRARIPFVPPERTGWHWETVRQLYEAVEADLIRAFSIGFFIRESEPREDGAVIIRKAQIFEISLVSIGAHKTALMQSIGDKARAAVHAVALEAERTDEDLVYLTHDEPEDEDAPRAMQHAPQGSIAYDEPDEYQRAQTADPETQEAIAAVYLGNGRGYRLQHHDPARPHNPVWPWVARSMALLLGARGGIGQMPEAVRLEAYAHLSEEYQRCGVEAPELRDYSPEEFREMHAQGQVYVPGMRTEGTMWQDPPAKACGLGGGEANAERVPNEQPAVASTGQAGLSEDALRVLAEQVAEKYVQSDELKAMARRMADAAIQNIRASNGGFRHARNANDR